MTLLPLLPIFHRLNREHFAETLVIASKPLVALRWSDGRLRKTAGFYRRGPKVLGKTKREIVLSKPLLRLLPTNAVESTLCHEMIHAWVDIVLGIEEGHGPNFLRRMHEINSSQNEFTVSVRHRFPVPKEAPKWLAVCRSCGFRVHYRRRVPGIACRRCCEEYHEGCWNSNFLLEYQLVVSEI